MYHLVVEHEIVFTGIGGQGVQLAARTLAEAAIADGHHVQLFASYGGMMRGGNSDSMLVVADGPVTAPPVIAAAWAGVVMHHEHARAAWNLLRTDALAVVNTSVVDVDALGEREAGAVQEVDALDLATHELGAPVAASLVLVGALVAATGLVSVDALLATPERVLPSYRADAAEVNRRALLLGLDQSGPTHRAWSPIAA